MPRKDKVYCDDCVYYQEFRIIPACGTGQSYTIQEECKSPKNIADTFDTYKCRMQRKLSPESLNNHNNCIYFSRKRI